MMIFPGKENVQSGMSGGPRMKFLQSESKWKRKKFLKKTDAKWNASLALHSMYEPPRLRELQFQNRMKTKKYFLKRYRAPRAPRNTTSFIMRAKKSGGLTYLISPATPAILPTPVLSPASRYREVLVDEVNKEWGVDGYGSMNGLIRLRCPDNGDRENDTRVFENESDVEQGTHVQSVQQLEQRIDYDLSRFEICYPPKIPVKPYVKPVDVRMEEQENRIAQLEDEILSMKEHLFLFRQEMRDLQGRMGLQRRHDYKSDDNPEVCSERTGGDATSALR